MLLIEFFFKAEKRGGIELFGGGGSIGESQAAGKEFDFRFGDLLGEFGAWAFGGNAAFGTEGVFREMIQAVEDTVFDFTDNIVYDDMGALRTEIGTAFISGPGGEECPVVGKDFESNHIKLMEDLHQDMKEKRTFTPEFKMDASAILSPKQFIKKLCRYNPQ